MLLGALLLVAVVGVSALVGLPLLLRSKEGRPIYKDMLVRMSGQFLACAAPGSGPNGEIRLQLNASDNSLQATVGGKSSLLAYSGSFLFSDYFEGPDAQSIEVDPEIKVTGFSAVGGYCQE